MEFNYWDYFWSEQTEEHLYKIIKGKGLDSGKARAQQELNRRTNNNF